MLSPEFITHIYSLPEIDPRMQRARDMNNDLVMHVEGVKELVDKFLIRINNYENEGQHLARIRHTITNKFVTSELLRPTDNVFGAKGGSKIYKFSTEKKDAENELIDKLQNLSNGYKLSQYMEQVWFRKLITDPNGLIFMEVTNKDNIEDNEIYPTYKNIHTIKAYKQKGIFVDWVIFEPHKKIKDVKNKEEEARFWAVDEINYYEYEIKLKNGDSELHLINEIPHDFGKVPAVLCSDIIDNYPITNSIYNEDWKKSPIDDQIELLNKYLTSNSVLTLQEFMHAYAREWEYGDDCKACNGTGIIENKGLQSRDNESNNTPCDCSNGQYKRKDPTDSIIMRPPEDGQQKLDPPGGYIYLPTEPWELQVTSVDRYFDLIFRSQWQTTYEKQENATATGRFIDAQPVNNRLNKYSTTTEIIYTAITNFIGKYNFPDTFERAFIQLGRRYLIETPDQIWKKYLESKKDKAPVSSLDLLLFQFLESEFKENEQMLVYEIKKAKLEPFIHYEIGTVRSSNYITDEDKRKKEYFNEWIKTKSINDVTQTDFEILNKELTNFANGKIIIPEQNNNLINN